MDYSEQLTDNARAVLMHAEILALLEKSKAIGTEHILMGILDQPESVAAGILYDTDLDVNAVRRSLKLKPGTAVVTSGPSAMPLSDATKMMMHIAMKIAKEFHQEKCGTIHILYSLLSIEDSKACEMLSKHGVKIDELLSEVEDMLAREMMPYIGDDDDDERENVLAGGAQRRSQGNKRSAIAAFSTDLTRLAQEGKLDPVIGREREIDRMIAIICRKNKNNPVLIGEAGVGKTAIVEGLAQRIASGNVPSFLADRKVIEVDMAAMIAGTQYRGQFEERLQRLIKEVEADDSLIVFIDEIHLIVGAGSAEGTMDAANQLKPALARGKFRLIGATTNDEYRKRIEKDAALARRFQEIEVAPPSTADTIKIISGIVPRYEDYHRVKIGDDVVKEIVRLSDRYLSGREQPDKAIDVLDETAARVHIANGDSDNTKQLTDCRAEMLSLTRQMEKAVVDEDYEHAALFKMRVSQLRDKIAELRTRISDSGTTNVKLNDVAATVSRMTGVPLEQLERSEVAKLANLEKRLSKRIIGQGQAVSSVVKAIRRSRAGVGNPNRPIGSFIFLGATGVGKTELARVLANEVFGSTDSLIKVDMSEFSEKHTVSRLVGAPAGYVGYDDGGQLTERVRRQPYSVILFDEIEKAHPDVFNVLLQILEDGVLTDGHGKKVDFTNCVIILTSNIGASELTREPLGFTLNADAPAKSDNKNRQEAVMKSLRQVMRPELLNRFDQIVLFNNLTNREVGQICDLMLKELSERLLDNGIALKSTVKLRHHLARVGYDPKYGARPMRRAIQDELECALADEIIAGNIKRGDIVEASYENSKVVLSKISESKKRKSLQSSKNSTKATKS